MATLATYGLTSRPSTRSIAAGASQGDTTVNRYEPRTIDDADLNVSRADAEARLRGERPELFWTESQIRADVIKGIGDRTSFGKSSRAKYISTEVNQRMSSNKYARSAEVDRIYSTLQTEARRELEKQQKAEAEKARQAEIAARNAKAAESQRATDRINARNGQSTVGGKYAAKGQQGADLTGGAMSAGNLSNLGGGTLDADTVKYLNYLDLSARVAIKQNPDLYEGFDNYISYASQLAAMSPDEREAELAALREEANDIVDPYFDTQETRVKDDLKATLANLNAQFGLFKESEKYQLDQKIDGLTRDAAETLSTNFLDMKRRGVLDSGIARNIADKIIEGKTRSEEFEKTISDFRERDVKMRKEYTADRTEVNAERAVEDINTERQSQQEQQFFGLLSEEEARTFMQQFDGSSTLKQYGDDGTKAGSGIGAGRSTTLPTGSAPAGSSLDLSRRQQAGEISIEEQRSARDALMFPTTAPKPVTTVKPTTKTSNVATSKPAPVSAKTMPGSTLLQRSAARGAARASNRK